MTLEATIARLTQELKTYQELAELDVARFTALIHAKDAAEAEVARLTAASPIPTTWLCGCGTWNGVNLATCRVCTRPATESDVTAQFYSAEAAAPQQMADAAEMLWVVLANVSGGDWSQQSAEWQEAAARWRDNYFAVLKGTPVIARLNNDGQVEGFYVEGDSAAPPSPSEKPHDATGQGRLLLNAYGRECYVAGQKSQLAAPLSQAQEITSLTDNNRVAWEAFRTTEATSIQLAKELATTRQALQGIVQEWREKARKALVAKSFRKDAYDDIGHEYQLLANHLTQCADAIKAALATSGES